MSGGPAALQPPADRLESFAVRMRGHEWVDDARLVPAECGPAPPGAPRRATALVVPSAAGVRAMRRSGKQRLVAAWEQYVQPGDGAARDGCDWRLVAALPATGHEAEGIAALAGRAPTASDLVCDPQARSLTCRLLIPFELPMFTGHFPSTPIVPGVLQVGWAIELARCHGLVDTPFRGISQAKFRRLVQPGMHLALRVACNAATGQLHFEYRSGTAVVSTGRVQFEAAHA